MKISDLTTKVISNKKTKEIIAIFLSAINDWPSSVTHLKQYELEVGELINNVVNKRSIELFLSQIDLSTSAWQAESLSELLELYQFYSDGTTLTEIIEDLNNRLGSV